MAPSGLVLMTTQISADFIIMSECTMIVHIIRISLKTSKNVIFDVKLTESCFHLPKRVKTDATDDDIIFGFGSAPVWTFQPARFFPTTSQGMLLYQRDQNRGIVIVSRIFEYEESILCTFLVKEIFMCFRIILIRHFSMYSTHSISECEGSWL